MERGKYIRTEETLGRMRASLKGRKCWLKGKKMTEKHRINLSNARKGMRLSLETRKKISNSLIGMFVGEKGPNWQGGITPLNQSVRNSFKMKEWRKSVFERDNYTCIWGGKAHGNKLNADHIKPFALYPELRFELSNGRTLCIPCHKKTGTWGGVRQPKI